MSDEPKKVEPTTEEPVAQFTQEQLDAIVKSRISREKAKYADYDELKNIRDEWQASQTAAKSDLEQALEKVAAAERERDKAKEDAERQLIVSAFVAEASKQGALHPEDAFALSGSNTIALEDGKITGVEEQVSLLVENGRLPVKKTPASPPLDGGAGALKRPSDGDVKLTAEQLKMAESLNLKPEEYSKQITKE